MSTLIRHWRQLAHQWWASLPLTRKQRRAAVLLVLASLGATVHLFLSLTTLLLSLFLAVVCVLLWQQRYRLTSSTATNRSSLPVYSEKPLADQVTLQQNGRPQVSPESTVVDFNAVPWTHSTAASDVPIQPASGGAGLSWPPATSPTYAFGEGMRAVESLETPSESKTMAQVVSVPVSKPLTHTAPVPVTEPLLQSSGGAAQLAPLPITNPLSQPSGGAAQTALPPSSDVVAQFSPVPITEPLSQPSGGAAQTALPPSSDVVAQFAPVPFTEPLLQSSGGAAQTALLPPSDVVTQFAPAPITKPLPPPSDVAAQLAPVPITKPLSQPSGGVAQTAPVLVSAHAVPSFIQTTALPPVAVDLFSVSVDEPENSISDVPKIAVPPSAELDPFDDDSLETVPISPASPAASHTATMVEPASPPAHTQRDLSKWMDTPPPRTSKTTGKEKKTMTLFGNDAASMARMAAETARVARNKPSPTFAQRLAGTTSDAFDLDSPARRDQIGAAARAAALEPDYDDGFSDGFSDDNDDEEDVDGGARWDEGAGARIDGVSTSGESVVVVSSAAEEKALKLSRWASIDHDDELLSADEDEDEEEEEDEDWETQAPVRVLPQIMEQIAADDDFAGFDEDEDATGDQECVRATPLRFPTVTEGFATTGSGRKVTPRSAHTLVAEVYEDDADESDDEEAVWRRAANARNEDFLEGFDPSDLCRPLQFVTREPMTAQEEADAQILFQEGANNANGTLDGTERRMVPMTGRVRRSASPCTEQDLELVLPEQWVISAPVMTLAADMGERYDDDFELDAHDNAPLQLLNPPVPGDARFRTSAAQPCPPRQPPHAQQPLSQTQAHPALSIVIRQGPSSHTTVPRETLPYDDDFGVEFPEDLAAHLAQAPPAPVVSDGHELDGIADIGRHVSNNNHHRRNNAVSNNHNHTPVRGTRAGGSSRSTPRAGRTTPRTPQTPTSVKRMAMERLRERRTLNNQNAGGATPTAAPTAVASAAASVTATGTRAHSLIPITRLGQPPSEARVVNGMYLDPERGWVAQAPDRQLEANLRSFDEQRRPARLVAPQALSHQPHGSEVGDMRFDAHRLTWVRFRPPLQPHGNAPIAPDDDEENCFAGIPFLKKDKDEEEPNEFAIDDAFVETAQRAGNEHARTLGGGWATGGDADAMAQLERHLYGVDYLWLVRADALRRSAPTAPAAAPHPNNV